MEIVIALGMIAGGVWLFVRSCRALARMKRERGKASAGFGDCGRMSSGSGHASPNGSYDSTQDTMEWKTTSFVDHSGTLRNPGEPYVDHSGTLRFPGEPYVDCSGTLRNPGEPYADKSGTLRFPGEPYVDESGDLRW